MSGIRTRHSRNRLILLRRFAAWIVVLGVVVLLIDYSFDVSKRRSREPTCVWNSDLNPGNAPYVARWCKLTKDTILFRLYDTDTQELLAERTYMQLDGALIGWRQDRVWYDTYADDMYVSLPPTWLDRLRARLP